MGINLDEARAARREAMNHQPDPITFCGEEFNLPVELPLTAVRWMVKLGDASSRKDGSGITEALEGAVAALLSPADLERFTAFGPSLEDLAAIIEGIPHEYGFDTVGESKASADSPKITGARSRPASKPRTKLTPRGTGAES